MIQTVILLPLENVSVFEGKRTRGRIRDADTNQWIEIDLTSFGSPRAIEHIAVPNRRAAYAHPFTPDEMTWIRTEVSRQSATVRRSIHFTHAFPYNDLRGWLWDDSPVDIPAWRYPP